MPGRAGATGSVAVVERIRTKHRDFLETLRQLRLKSMYRSRAIPTVGKAVYGPKTRNQYASPLPPAQRRATSKLYAHYDVLLELKKQAEAELVAESKKHSITRVLQTAPGLGPIRVARMLPIVITPHRFRTKRQFWSYCGLGIVMRSSSDWVRTDAGEWQRALVAKTRGLSRRHNQVLKDTFKSAATSVILQGARVPIYAEYERQLEAGTKPNLAKLTLARKIGAIVLRMWKDEEVYRPPGQVDGHDDGAIDALGFSVARHQAVIAPIRAGGNGSQASIHGVLDLETRWARRSHG